MTTHKTFTGMANAVRNLIAELDASPITSDQDFRADRRKMDGLLKELNAAWANDAQALDAAKLKNELLDAWHKATN
jgi:hypothetical protein